MADGMREGYGAAAERMSEPIGEAVALLGLSEASARAQTCALPYYATQVASVVT
jgi:hypothetical protein